MNHYKPANIDSFVDSSTGLLSEPNPLEKATYAADNAGKYITRGIGQGGRKVVMYTLALVIALNTMGCFNQQRYKNPEYQGYLNQKNAQHSKDEYMKWLNQKNIEENERIRTEQRKDLSDFQKWLMRGLDKIEEEAGKDLIENYGNKRKQNKPNQPE